MLLESTSTGHWALGFLEWPGDVSQWPTRELRLYLEKRGIRHQAGGPIWWHSWKRGPCRKSWVQTPNFLQDCFEKIELVDRVKDAMAKGITGGSASPSPATSATSATGSSPRTPPQDSLGLGFGKGQYLGWLAVSERSPRGASYTLGSCWRFQAFEQKRVSWNSGVFPYMLMRRIWQPEDISDAKNM